MSKKNAKTGSKNQKAQKRTKQPAVVANPEATEPTAKPMAKATRPPHSLVPDSRVPPVGTLIQKLDRNGAVRCECSIDTEGIHYRGVLYRSLSAAAMAAAKDLGLANKTQNGFTFWGLSKPSRKSGDPLAGLNKAWERYRAHAEALTKAAERPEGLLPALDRHSKAMEALLGSVA